MTYTLNQLGGIVRDLDGACIPADPANTDYAAYVEWCAAGNTATPYQTPVEQLQANLTAAVQKILDDKAVEYHYDSIASAVTYADEPAVPKFQAEGQAFREWRSLVWAAAYAYLAEVQAGTKSFPTVNELPGLLPAFVAPETA